jgi:hypothetical protein
VARLADEIDREPIDGSELLRVVVKDHQHNLSTTQNAS